MYSKNKILPIWSFKSNKHLYEIDSYRICILKGLLQFIIAKKIDFLISPNDFLLSLENFIYSILKKQSKDICINDIFLIFKSAKMVLNKKSISESFDYIISCILQIVSSDKDVVVTCKISKDSKVDFNEYIIKICKKYGMNPLIIFSHNDSSLIAGFQIYFSDRRIEYSYQRILLSFKEEFQKFILDRAKS
jgi:F0F1-type ATP synthase delta subunit